MTRTYSPLRLAAALALSIGAPAYAATITFEGAFTSDDQMEIFTFSLANPGATILRTEGYAGNPAASRAPGGFDPVLSLFDATGFLIGLNRDGGCPAVAADPRTGNCWDSYLSVFLPPGQYFLALTEEDNLPFGPTFDDGFTRSGQGDFTPDLTGIPGQRFIDLSPDQRNGNWAVVLDGVDSASVPEPASFGLVLAGILLVAIGRVSYRPGYW
jgi:hypothetical protein